MHWHSTYKSANPIVLDSIPSAQLPLAHSAAVARAANGLALVRPLWVRAAGWLDCGWSGWSVGC
ncbi:hypothetical protein GCM10027360_38800 [Amycolatopsis echigonensis]